MKNTSEYVRCIDSGGDPISLTIGEIYEALPTSVAEQQDGWIRIVDNEGQPYLHPSQLFEPVPQAELTANHSETITVHLNGITKLKIRDRANAKGVSISALMREFAEEQLDLPEVV